MKKLCRILGLACLLTAILCCLTFQASAATVFASGYCGGEGDGTNLSWTLTDDGTLTISGTGAMKDYTYDLNPIAPWRGNADKIKTVVVAEGVTSVGAYALTDCKKAKTLWLSSTVEAFEASSAECGWELEEINVDSRNATFKSVNGILFSKDGSVLCRYPEGRKESAYVIPTGVKEVWQKAFMNAQNLNYLYFADTVTNVGIQVASGCPKLAEVKVSVNLSSIPNFAFDGCYSLTTVWVPRKCTKFGVYVFDGCKAIKDIYYGGSQGEWKQIKVSAGNTSLSNATIHYNSDYTATGVCPLSDETIVINGKGRGKAYFQLRDYSGTPVAGIEMVAMVRDVGYQRTTDQNGVFYVELPEVSYDDYTSGTRIGPIDLSIDVQFYEAENPNKVLPGANQTIEYQVTPAVFSQKWEGLISGGVAVSAGLGASAEAGDIASLDANLIKAKLGVNAGGQLSLTYDHTATGNNLTMSFKDIVDGGFSFKSGIEGTLLCAEVNVVKGSAGVNLVNESEAGIKIKDYQANNVDQQLAVASFLMQSAFSGNHSVWSQKFLEMLDINQHNQSAASQKLVVDTGATLLGYGTDVISEIDVEEAILNAESTTVLGYEKSRDLLEGITTYTASAKADNGYGFLKGNTMTEAGSVITAAGKYVWGNDTTNSMSVKSEHDSNGLQSLSYKVYMDGESDYNWAMESTDVYANVSYDAAAATIIAQNSLCVDGFLDEERGLLTPQQLSDMINSMAMSDQIGNVTEITARKSGLKISIPLSIQLGIGGGVEIGGKLTNSTNYSHATGIKTANALYTTSESSLTTQDIKNQEISILDILNGPIECLGNWLGNTISSAYDSLVSGVTNGYSAVKGAVEGFWVEVKNIGASAAPYASYAILAVEEEYVPETDAAVAVTVGDPYSVFVYEDSSMETLVEEAALSQNPMDITLGYTPEMLQAAGASLASDLYIYWFDNEKNVYVCMTDSVQDKVAKTVTCKGTRHGEYILATDNASPLISDFAVSNNTATPVITAYVSDLSGISEFSFWFDDKEMLIDETTLSQYYDPATGKFSYQVEDPLPEGDHVAWFTATDNLGNRNAEPFQFSFNVDANAPQIIETDIPSKAVIAGESFTVTAVLSNDADVAGVTVAVTANEKVVSYPMYQNEDGMWVAEITIMEAMDVDVSVVVTDFSGNITRGEEQTVKVVDESGNLKITLPDELLAQLPDPVLSQVHVYDYTAEDFYVFGNWMVADDIDATAGKSVRYAFADEPTWQKYVYSLPYNNSTLFVGDGSSNTALAYWNMDALNANSGQGYRLYKFEDIVIGSSSAGKWINLWDNRNYDGPVCNYDASLKGKTVDLYISLKMEGTIHEPNSWDSTDAVFYIDRVIMVEKCDVPEWSYVGATCTANAYEVGDCTVCGAENIVEHVETKFSHVYEGYVWDDGYSAACLNCGEVKTPDTIEGKLPDELVAELQESGVGLEHVYDFPVGTDYANVSVNGTWWKLVDDETAAAGKAGQLIWHSANTGITAERPWVIKTNSGTVLGQLTYEQISAYTDGQYHLYKITAEPVTLPSHVTLAVPAGTLNSQLWFWGVMTQLKGQTVDLYLSFKLDTETEGTDYAYVDRLIAVKSDCTGEACNCLPLLQEQESTGTVVPGDINGDGETNLKDLTRLFQYLADWDVEVNEAVLDVNGDGSINLKDQTRLFQYLADWDVEIYPVS